MNHNNAQEILQFILTATGAKPSGTGWQARCPAHNDRTPSLSIRIGDSGNLLLNCHAGCSVKDICGQLGIKQKDLMASGDHDSFVGSARSGPVRNGKPSRRFATSDDAIQYLDRELRGATLVNQWPYHDIGGAAICVVARWNQSDGKTYRPVYKTADGMWQIGAPPEPRPLFNLPAIASAQLVFVLEGEKCATLANDLGIVATTSISGSRSAAKSDWSPLKGRDAVLIPDCDLAGGAYAANVAKLLSEAGAQSVRIVRLPNLSDGEDFEQWIERFGDAAEPECIREELLKLVAAAEHVGDTIRAASDTQDESSGPDWPHPLEEEALHGLAGEIVRTLEPWSEADPVAILIQLLVGIGNIIGRTAYFTAESDRHHLNLFACLVGQTGRGRKGASWGRVEQILKLVDPEWATERVKSGLASGEALIWTIRDQIVKQEPIKERGRITGYTEVITDHGVSDKRLLTMEGEFANVLQIAGRERCILSGTIRNAWDGRRLENNNKSSPCQASDPHVSIIGHITTAELRKLLASTDRSNGFANRFLWVCCRRSKLLPESGAIPLHEAESLAAKLRSAIAFARECGELRRDHAARAIWRKVYGPLSAGRPGLLGDVTGRAEAQVMRLATLYAVLDQSPEIAPSHLGAALAIWRYAEASARYIFAGGMADTLAERILTKLREVHPEPLSRTNIRDLFGRNLSADTIAEALAIALDSGQARCERSATGGRPTERWYAVAIP